VDVHEYDRMQERLEILEEVYKAEEQIASGAGITHDDARLQVVKRLAR